MLPQIYRIVIDCGCLGFDPKLLKTAINRVQDNTHLIVCSDIRRGCQFKRSYTLPKEVVSRKMKKYVTPNGQLVIEFCYLDTPTSLALNLQPKICNAPEGKCVHVHVPIPDFVDPSKVQLQVKGRELIVRLEERIIPHCDSAGRVLYHNRVKLPDNTNVSAISAKSDKHKLTIVAPVVVKGVGKAAPISQQLREITIHRKLRHRLTRTATGGEERKVPVTGGVEKISPIGKKQAVTPTKAGRAISPSAEKKQQQQVTTGAQKKKTTTAISAEKLQQKPTVPSQKKQKKQAVETQKLAGTTAEKKKTPAPISGEGEKGSDILKKVFETGTEGKKSPTGQRSPPHMTESEQQQQGQSSSNIGSVLGLGQSEHRQHQ